MKKKTVSIDIEQTSVLHATYIKAMLQIIINDIRAFFEFYDKNN